MTSCVAYCTLQIDYVTDTTKLILINNTGRAQRYVFVSSTTAVRISTAASHTSRPAAVRLVNQPCDSTSSRTFLRADAGFVQQPYASSPSSSTSRTAAARLVQMPYVQYSNRTSHPAAVRRIQEPHTSSSIRLVQRPYVSLSVFVNPFFI